MQDLDLSIWLKDLPKSSSSAPGVKKTLPADNLSTWLTTRHAVKLESKLKAANLTESDLNMWLSSKRPRMSGNLKVKSVLDTGYDNEPLEFWLDQCGNDKRKVAKVQAETKDDDPLRDWLCPEKREAVQMENLEEGFEDLSLWLLEDHHDHLRQNQIRLGSEESQYSEWLQSTCPKDQTPSTFGFEIINSPLSRWKPEEKVEAIDDGLKMLHLESGNIAAVASWLERSFSTSSSSTGSSSSSSSSNDEDEVIQWLSISEQLNDDDESSIVIIDDNQDGSYVFQPSTTN